MSDNNPGSPVREYRTIVNDSGDPGYTNRVLIGIAVTGLVRVEWVGARYGQIIPTNWSQVEMQEWMNSYMPLRYQVADAQNLICKVAVEKDFEWLLLYEHDVIPPPNAFQLLNIYMQEEKVPVVSGLYYTRSRPSEPLVYRGRGTSYYSAWKPGDLVWCDGVPTGFLLIHMGIIREMWKDSKEYTTRGQVTRRVFDTPRHLWTDPETKSHNTISGTSDLDWCTKLIQGGYFGRAGWHKYEELKYPLLVDTRINCRHINPNGEIFP